MFNLRADWSPADAWTVWTALNYHGKSTPPRAWVRPGPPSRPRAKEYKAYTLADLA
jgi:outer membrane receptor for ferrienterochelin and colicins